MAHFWEAQGLNRTRALIRGGGWLTRQRVKAYSLIMLGLGALAIVGWVALSDGLIDRNGRPLGTDFSSFYAAGSLALQGKAADAYSLPLHFAREQQIFGADTPYYAWLYPPSFLVVVAPLALLPYPLALAAWQTASFALYLGAIDLVLRRRQQPRPGDGLWLLAAAAFPATLINFGHGQNGFLTAGLLCTALLALPSRPLLAGLLLGLLSYKPQFGLVIPFALIAGGQWRALVAAAFTVLALVTTTGLSFGPDAWAGFLAASETSRRILLEQGGVGFEKLQSVFAAVRLWGGSVALAYTAQAVVTGTAVCCVAWIWRSDCAFDLKAALLAIATLLASPHVLDYDLVVLAVSIAFFVRYGLANGFRDYEITLLAAAWIVPLLTRGVAGATGIPLGLVLMMALFALALRRALLDRATSTALQRPADAN